MLAYLEAWGGSEFLVLEELVHLILGLNHITLVEVASSEYGGDVLVVPFLDIVVSGIPSVNVPLDGISLVADHEAEI